MLTARTSTSGYWRATSHTVSAQDTELDAIPVLHFEANRSGVLDVLVRYGALHGFRRVHGTSRLGK